MIGRRSILWLSSIPLHLIFSLNLIAQGEESVNTGNDIARHKIMVMLGHAQVPEGIDKNGNRSWLVLPSWGLDYDFSINEKWCLGLHSDFVVENYTVSDEKGIQQNRSRPLASTICISRKFGTHLSLILGGGAEFAEERNLGLARAGVDYGWELPKEWELSISLMTDYKIESYFSFVYGIGVARRF